VGGLPTADGRRVRTGLLYRSSALDRLAGPDASEVASLGIRTIFDFRTEAERTGRPDRVPAGVRYVPADILDGMTGHTPGQIQAAMADPAVAREVLGDGKGTAMFVDQYRAFVTLPGARRTLGSVFAELADGHNRPALIHCMGGKDRTGWAAASLLLFLGVPVELVTADFMASNEHLGGMFRGLFDDFAARGGDPELLSAFLWVSREYLAMALDQVATCFGTIEGYFSEGMGLDDATLDTLRAAFVE
jgi:protein-tyrosine phosphatase